MQVGQYLQIFLIDIIYDGKVTHIHYKTISNFFYYNYEKLPYKFLKYNML
jgi:hypothetical protein